VSGLDTALTRDTGIEVPLIGGAMFPCSNAELVAAVSAGGGIGIVQPLALEYVHRQKLTDGLQLIRRTADRHERADRAIVRTLPRAHATLRRHRARSGRHVLHHLAGEAARGIERKSA